MILAVEKDLLVRREDARGKQDALSWRTVSLRGGDEHLEYVKHGRESHGKVVEIDKTCE